LKHVHFMIVIGGVFCMGYACDKQMQDVFQSSRLPGVRF